MSKLQKKMKPIVAVKIEDALIEKKLNYNLPFKYKNSEPINIANKP